MKNKHYFMLIFGFFLILGLTACAEEECLAHGENCRQSYIDDNYGGKRPPCCESGDVCQESLNGYLTCN